MDGQNPSLPRSEVGCIQNDMDDFERQTAYAADITYGTNNEFGFDYLRDNMKFDLATCVQRGHYFAHRRRGRFDPDRRSAHAADHLGPVGRSDRQVLQSRRIIPQLNAAKTDEQEDRRLRR